MARDIFYTRVCVPGNLLLLYNHLQIPQILCQVWWIFVCIAMIIPLTLTSQNAGWIYGEFLYGVLYNFG